MDSVTRQRSLGIVVLIALGVGLPFALSHCFNGGQPGGEADTRAVSIDAGGDSQDSPSGSEDAAADQASATPQSQTSGPQAATDGGQNPQPAGADANAAKRFETPPVKGKSSASPPAAAADQAAPSASERPAPPTAENDQQSASADAEKNAPKKAAAKPPQSNQDEPQSRPAGGRGDWLVQVASFRDKNNATALVAKLKTNYASGYARAQVDGKTYYRVHAGPFASRKRAEQAAQSLSQGGRKPYVHRR